MSNIVPAGATDREVLQEIGRRLGRLRDSRRMSQTEVARLSGLSRRTVYGAESGENPTLLTLVRLLRTYGRLGALDDFIPVPEISPIAVIEGDGVSR